MDEREVYFCNLFHSNRTRKMLQFNIMKNVVNNYALKFVAIFVSYGVLIAFLMAFIEYYEQRRVLHQNMMNEALYEANQLNTKAASYIKNVEQTISALKDNPLFLAYLENNSTDAPSDSVNQLFLFAVTNQSNIFQVRYIDERGMEKIRSERVRNKGTTYIVPADQLQNKQNRYYFSETLALKDGMFWYSPVDLNVEYKQLEKPLRPTLRVAAPVYYNGKAHGIIIVNVEMTNLLHALREHAMPSFHLYLIDESGYILIEPSGEYDFSRYLGKNTIISDLLPNIAVDDLRAHLDKKTHKLITHFAITASNGEQLYMILMPNKDRFHQFYSSIKKSVYRIVIALLLIALPLGLLLAIPAIRLERALRAAEKEKEEYVAMIEKAAHTDTLTQVSNRLNLDNILEQSYERYKRYGNPFSIILLDVDHFKKINDTYGHQIGDKVLQTFANVLMVNTRKTDHVGRWGGEEFLIVCDGSALEGANQLATILQKAIRNCQFLGITSQTASFGVATFHHDDTLETLLGRADTNLYKAKENGRDCIVSETVDK